MTKLYVVRERRPEERNFFQRSSGVQKKPKSLQDYQRELLPGRLGSARIECIVDTKSGFFSNTVTQIKVIQGETLGTGEESRVELGEHKEKRIYTLQQFSDLVKSLGKKEGLKVDFKTGTYLQEVFNASQEEKARFLEHHIERNLNWKARVQHGFLNREDFFKLLKEAYACFGCVLPMKNALNLYHNRFAEVDLERIEISEKIGFIEAVKLYKSLNALEANASFFSSAEVIEKSSYYSIFSANNFLPDYFLHLNDEGITRLLKFSLSKTTERSYNEFYRVCSNLIIAHCNTTGRSLNEAQGWLVDHFETILEDLPYEDAQKLFSSLNCLKGLKGYYGNLKGNLLTQGLRRKVIRAVTSKSGPITEKELLLVTLQNYVGNAEEIKRGADILLDQSAARVIKVISYLPKRPGLKCCDHAFQNYLATHFYEKFQSQLQKDPSSITQEQKVLLLHLFSYLDGEQKTSATDYLLQLPKPFLLENLPENIKGDAGIGLSVGLIRAIQKRGKGTHVSFEEGHFALQLILQTQKLKTTPLFMISYDHLLGILARMEKKERLALIQSLLENETPCAAIEMVLDHLLNQHEKSHFKPITKQEYKQGLKEDCEEIAAHFIPKTLAQLNVFTQFLNVLRPSKTQFEKVISNLQDLNQLFKLSPELLAVWSNTLQEEKVMQLNASPSLEMKTYIPSLPTHGAEPLTRTLWTQFLDQKGFSPSLKENLKMLWKKKANLVQKAFQTLLKQHLAKVVDLSKKGEITDRDLRIFLSNIQLEHDACWPGLCQKLKKEYRKLTLKLMKDELPPSFQKVSQSEALKERYEPFLKGAVDRNLSFEPTIRALHKEVKACAELLLTEAAKGDKVHAIEALYIKVLENARAQVPEALSDKLFDDYGVNTNQLSLIQALRGKELSEDDFFDASGFPSHSRAFFKHRLTPLINKGWLVFNKETNTYALKKEEPKLKVVFSELDRVSFPKEKALSAVHQALREACEQTPQVQTALREEAQFDLKIDLIASSNQFFENWLEAHREELKLAMTELYLNEAGKAKVEEMRELGESPEAILKLIDKEDSYTDTAKARTEVHSINSSGHEVHLLAAAKEIYSQGLGLDPQSAKGDHYAHPFKGAVALCRFGEKVEQWNRKPAFEDLIALNSYLADELNLSAPLQTDQLEHYSLILYLLNAHLDTSTSSSEEKERLMALCFTPEEEEKKPRITPMGVNLLLHAAPIGLLQEESA